MQVVKMETTDEAAQQLELVDLSLSNQDADVTCDTTQGGNLIVHSDIFKVIFQVNQGEQRLMERLQSLLDGEQRSQYALDGHWRRNCNHCHGN